MSTSMKWLVCSALLVAAACDEQTEAHVECPDGLVSVPTAEACTPDSECLRVEEFWCTDSPSEACANARGRA